MDLYGFEIVPFKLAAILNVYIIFFKNDNNNDVIYTKQYRFDEI